MKSRNKTIKLKLFAGQEKRCIENGHADNGGGGDSGKIRRVGLTNTHYRV